MDHFERQRLIYRPIFSPHSRVPGAYFGCYVLAPAYRWAGIQVGLDLTTFYNIQQESRRIAQAVSAYHLDRIESLASATTK